MKTFVGAWESLVKHRFPPSRDDRATWEELRESAGFYARHLNETLIMLFEAVARGDEEAAGQLTDVLLMWWDQLRFRFAGHTFYWHREPFITIESLSKDWDEAKELVDIQFTGDIQVRAQRVVFEVALRNYWVDACCIALYILAAWGKSCECDESLPARLMMVILRGAPLGHGGTKLGDLRPLANADDLIYGIVRQRHVDGRYRAKLNGVVNAIADISEPERVSGRIYSGWGANDLDSLQDGLLVLLCILVTKDWNPAAKLDKTIRLWIATADEATRQFRANLEQWSKRLGHAEFHDYESLFLCVLGARDNDEPFESAVKEAKRGVDELLSSIDKMRTETLRQADVSKRRLDEVAVWASRLGFSKETGGFPLPLFENIGSSLEKHFEHTLVFKNMSKGGFTEPEMDQRPTEEDFAETVKIHVAASVMAEAIHELNPEPVDGSTPDLYWEQIKRSAAELRRNRLKPILLIESQISPSWIWDWTRGEYGERSARPPDLRLTRDEESSVEGYLGNLNDIAVYSAPISTGASYLLAKEAMDTVRFKDYGNRQFVDVTYEPVPDNDLLLHLRLTWRVALQVRQYPAARIVYESVEETP